MTPLVRPRAITRNGGRKPKGGGRIGCRLSQPARDALAELQSRWKCDLTAAVERAVTSEAGREDNGTEEALP